MFGFEDDPKRASSVTALRARPLSGVNQGVGLFCHAERPRGTWSASFIGPGSARLLPVVAQLPLPACSNKRYTRNTAQPPASMPHFSHVLSRMPIGG